MGELLTRVAEWLSRRAGDDGDIGATQLDLVELTQVVEERYEIDLEGSDFKNIATVGDVVDLVVAKVG